MKDKRNLNEVVTIIKEEMSKIQAKELILFGSQAKGDANEDSDYDFLIIVDDAMQTTAINALSYAIQKRLWDLSFPIPVDIIIKQASKYEEEKESFGSLAYHAKVEGLAI